MTTFNIFKLYESSIFDRSNQSFKLSLCDVQEHTAV